MANKDSSSLFQTQNQTQSPSSAKTSHGGRRANAGRSKGSGKYGEPTVSRRLPESWASEIDSMLQDAQLIRHSKEITGVLRPLSDTLAVPMALPIVGSKVPAGFPSPAEDFMEGKLDLNAHLIPHPAATFFVRVSGESMTGAGIFPGDLLIVDRSEEARHGDVVIAVVDTELTVKRLYWRDTDVHLVAENPAFPNIQFTDESDLVIWGVVRSTVHEFKR